MKTKIISFFFFFLQLFSINQIADSLCLIFWLQSIYASGDKNHDKRRFLFLLFRVISLKTDLYRNHVRSSSLEAWLIVMND